MDCDKFEEIMLDELYGELDDLTSAAARRHMAGCARCSALLGGLRATRRVATLPAVAPSEGFEDRLLAAVTEAEARSKPPLGVARVISLGGRWAMRPQTAMAAVFLLMVGTSSVLFSRRAPKSAAEEARTSFTVTENGAPAVPAASAPPREEEPALDPLAAAAAHGPAAPPVGRTAPPVPSPFATSPPSAPSMKAGGSAATLDDAVPSSDEGFVSGEKKSASSKQAYALPHAARRADGLGALGGGSAAHSQAADLSPPGGFAPPPPPPRDDDKASPLAAARSERDTGGGCAAAASLFDAVATAAWGTSAGYDATFEGAQCYARLGQADAARSRYDRLLTVPAYASRAQAGINATSVVATKARAVSKPASHPEQAPATPAAAPSPPEPKR